MVGVPNVPPTWLRFWLKATLEEMADIILKASSCALQAMVASVFAGDTGLQDGSVEDWLGSWTATLVFARRAHMTRIGLGQVVWNWPGPMAGAHTPGIPLQSANESDKCRPAQDPG